jgi:DNA-binding response OmpR family regulator
MLDEEPNVPDAKPSQSDLPGNTVETVPGETAPGETSPPEGLRDRPKLLLVDDNDGLRASLAMVLKHNGFDVTTGANVKEALGLISTQTFDVLLSDLHMPEAGDGLTVVSAMRHSNPAAVTLIFSAYPAMKQATAAILLQTDEIMVKPLAVEILVKTIHDRLKLGAHPTPAVESVADILEEYTQVTIDEWLLRVDVEPHIISVQLSNADRSSHLPALFHDLVTRLRNPLPLGTRALVSASAHAHGLLRRQQGYSAAMLVEESRMLQVSIFQTLQNNLHHMDFSVLLVGVMAIADEVDSQLAQAMTSYISESKINSASGSQAGVALLQA